MACKIAKLLAVVLCSTTALQACSRFKSSRDEPSHLDPPPAADYLVAAFDRVPLVAFREPRHGAGGTRELLQSVLHHPRFADTVNDIVVEFGNARYQGIADRYVEGQPTPRDQLKAIWEDTTVATGVWTAPVPTPS